MELIGFNPQKLLLWLLNQHELAIQPGVVNLLRFTLVNFNRFWVVSFNRGKWSV
jgi:hypothetical protein